MEFLVKLMLFMLLLSPSNNSIGQVRLTLDHALKRLDSLNVDLKQAKIKGLLAEQDVTDAKNALFPKIDLGASHNYNLGLAFDQIAGELVTGNRWTNSANANIGMQATVFQGFALRNEIKNAVLTLESTHLETQSLNRTLKLELIDIYFTAIANKALYASSVEQLKFSREQLRIQEEQFDMGTKTLVDLSLAESQVATDELNVITSNNNCFNSLNELKQLLNIPYIDSIELEAPAHKVVEKAILDMGKEVLSASRNPSVAMAEINLAKAKLTKKIADNSYLPTLSFSGGYGTNYSSVSRNFLTGDRMPFWDQANQNRSLYFGVTLSIPVFNGFSVRSNKNKANLEVQLQQREKEKVESEQEKVYQQAAHEYYRAQQGYVVAKKQFKSLKTALDAMSERYDLGVASSIDFARALLDHNLAEFNLISAKYNFLHSEYALFILLNKL